MPEPIPHALCVLGVDTSLRATGIGVVTSAGTRLMALHHEVIRNPAGRPLSLCLANLQAAMTRIIATWHPDVAAIEGVFFSKYARTALILGEARGVVIAACATAALPVYEYEPRRVKQAVVGNGAATKEQIQHMIGAQLSLASPPSEDAADALAIAICHLHSLTRLRLGTSQPI